MVPELGRTFRCPPTFRVFAAQNPLGEGGGRKGLPASFLNRFTKVAIASLTRADLLSIASARFPALVRERAGAKAGAGRDESMREHGHECEQTPDKEGEEGEEGSRGESLLSSMINFNCLIHRDSAERGAFGRSGAPWEFNLRDVFRWSELMLAEQVREREGESQ